MFMSSLECMRLCIVYGCGTVAIVNNVLVFRNIGGVEICIDSLLPQGMHLRSGGQDVGIGVSAHCVRFVAMSIDGSIMLVVFCASGLSTAIPELNQFCQVRCRWLLIRLASMTRPLSRVCSDSSLWLMAP